MSSESTSGEHLIIRPGTGRVRSRAGSRPAATPGGALEELLKRSPRLAHQPVGAARVVADGVHLSCEGMPFRVRGVTYGSFLPREDGAPFPEPRLCRHDLLAIADAGLNVVRTYSLPPRDLQDTAAEQGLRLLVGLHYDDWRMLPTVGRRGRRQVLDAGRRAVDAAMAQCAGRPEVLGIAVGNEVPVDLVRLYGIGAVEEILSELVAAVHAADPAMLATYVNFPTTEFLDVAGQDLVCFNVFLERPEAWRAYLRRLQVQAGERPLLVTECGLASEVHGEAAQAERLEWMLAAADEVGVGASVFSWTDDWGVGGQAVTGWGFGITDARRRPKPALGVVERWAKRPLRLLREQWPAVSVVVCARNESRHIEQCLRSLMACDYPGLEVIVCDDGSTDGTLELARQFPVTVLPLAHGGLSAARNAGRRAARGEIVAYLDADAYCHPSWPYHLALAFESPEVVAAGGPNLPVPGSGFAERVVAASPGGPMHVLLSDDRAEHLPGCNLAVRASALETIGGFDEVFVSAGDDVDLCWRLLDRGGRIGFAPAAQVRHHRRASLRAYLRQQRGYGRSERMVASRHPDRYNRLGQARWHGFIYGGQRMLPSLLRPVIYHGYAGGAPFQPVERRPSEMALGWMLALLPLVAVPALADLVFMAWWPEFLWLLLAKVALVAGCGVAVALAVQVPRDEPRPLAHRVMVGAMHVLQPFVRTWGRIRGRRLPPAPLVEGAGWVGNRDAWLRDLREALARRNYNPLLGGANDAADLVVTREPFVSGKITLAVAWHWLPAYRLTVRPRPAAVVVLLAGLLTTGVELVVGVAVSAGVVAGLAWSWLMLRRDVADAVGETTGGLAGRATGAPH